MNDDITRGSAESEENDAKEGRDQVIQRRGYRPLRVFQKLAYGEAASTTTW